MGADNGSTLPATTGGPPAADGIFGRTTKIRGLERVSDRVLGLRPRELRIIHAIRNRNDLGRPGQWRLDRELFDTLDVVLLSVQGFRQLQEGVDKANPRTTCCSADTLVPHPTVRVPKATDCTLCDYGQWDRSHIDPQTGKGAKPPPCQENFAFIGVPLAGMPESPVDTRPFFFLCRKTAAIAAKKFLAEANNNPRIGGLEECAVRFTLQEERGNKSGSGGVTYYVPIFTILHADCGRRYRGLADQALAFTYVPSVDGAVGLGSQDEGDEAPPDVEVPVAASDDSDIPF